MSQITISMPEDLERQLRDAAHESGYSSLSSYITEIVRKNLSGETPLDYWTRVGLWMQLQNNRMLATLTKGKELISEDDWELARTSGVLEEGIELDYNDIFLSVDRIGITRAKAKEVLHTLSMYEHMQASAEELGDDALSKRLEFPGYDGNRDYALIGYLEHLVKNHRFAHIKYRSPHNYNSHGMEPGYASMLVRYNEVLERQKTHDAYQMSVDDIKFILGR